MSGTALTNPNRICRFYRGYLLSLRGIQTDIFNLRLYKRKSRVERTGDKVWLEKPAKFDGVCKEVSTRLGSDAAVLVIAHFRETFRELEEALKAHSLSFDSLSCRLKTGCATTFRIQSRSERRFSASCCDFTKSS